MTTYVKGNNDDTWHWCSNCTHFPYNFATTQTDKPDDDNLCEQCQSKTNSNQCNIVAVR